MWDDDKLKTIREESFEEGNSGKKGDKKLHADKWFWRLLWGKMI